MSLWEFAEKNADKAGRQEQRLDYLIKELQKENRQYGNLKIPREKSEKRNLLRSLVNLRMPEPVGDKFLKVQDEFLRQEAMEKGITRAFDIPSVSEEYGYEGEIMEKLSLWQGDITTLASDAIVNAANSQMLGCFVPCHGCIDNAIHTAAGVQLRQECFQLMEKQGHEERTGTAKITKGYNLPSTYVIHTVGPVIQGSLREEDCSLLASCYESCIHLAVQHKLKTIAFCCISTGEFHFPGRRAAEIAIQTVTRFLKQDTSLKKVVFNVFKDEDMNIYRNALKEYAEKSL